MKRLVAILLLWEMVYVHGAEAQKLSQIPVRKLKVLAVLNQDEEGRNFSMPLALGLDPKVLEIYVVDSARAKVVIFSTDFFPRLSLDKGRGILGPYGITVDEQGKIYVCQGVSGFRSPRLSVFNGAGILEKEIVFSEMPFEGAGGFHPRSVAVDRRFVYVAGEGVPGVVVLDREGEFVKVLSVMDQVAPGLSKKKALIADVFVDRKGRLYLLSEEMGRFYVFDPLGHFLFKGGVKGGGPGKLSRPRGIAADPALGLILVVDYLRHTGLAYSYANGKLLFEFGGRGWTPGWFNYPTDIMIDTAGRIYVADLFNRRVQVFVFGAEEGMVSPVPSFIVPLQKVKPPRPKKLHKEGGP